MDAARNLPAAQTMPRAKQPILLTLLTVLTVASLAYGLYMGLVFAGRDLEQGDVQRIFYIHVSSFAGAFVALTAAVVGGILYLRTRNPKWDTFELAGVEVGLGLAILNLVTGAIWARPIWNTWWNWDPRLTSDAIMVLTYAAYLMLRSGIENIETRRRFAAVYAIFAIVTAIVTLLIIRVVPSTIHPVVIGPTFTGSEANVVGDFDLQATPGVTAALNINMIVWSVLVPITLMWHRIRLENFAEQVRAVKARLLE